MNKICCSSSNETQSIRTEEETGPTSALSLFEFASKKILLFAPTGEMTERDLGTSVTSFGDWDEHNAELFRYYNVPPELTSFMILLFIKDEKHSLWLIDP